jgi:hypothetical protein
MKEPAPTRNSASPEGYREISGAVEDNRIEIDGRQAPIVPENASRICAFVRACRSQRPAVKSCGLQPAPSLPVPVEQALHGFAHAFVVKHHGRPGGPRDHRVQ